MKYCDGKTGHSDGAVQVELRKNQGDDRSKNAVYCRGRSRTYKLDEIDVLLVYVPKADELCWIPSSEIDDKSHFTLRYDPPKNGQKKGVKLVENYIW